MHTTEYWHNLIRNVTRSTMAHGNRVKNMDTLAADVMARALNREYISSDDPVIQSEATKTLARLAFRFAMKACPVPPDVFAICVRPTTNPQFKAQLERRWNIKEVKVFHGRLSCRESNLKRNQASNRLDKMGY